MSQKKSEKELDEEWIEMILALESCDEAIAVLEEFFQCPVCGARIDSEGNMFHKDPARYIN